MTMLTIVVIIFLVWNFAVLYLPFDKRKKAILSGISFGVFLLFAMYDDARDKEVPACVVYDITNKPVEAQRHVMAMYGVEEWPTSEGEDTPPLEKGVRICVILVAIIVPLLLAIVRDKKDDKKELKAAHKIALILCSVALALLLSLYFGLKLTLLPFIKSRGQKTAEICTEGSRQPA